MSPRRQVELSSSKTETALTSFLRKAVQNRPHHTLLPKQTLFRNIGRPRFTHHLHRVLLVK